MQAQTPPRDPRTPPRDVSAQSYHRRALEIWETSRAASLTPDAQLELVRQGSALEDKALAINPDYVEALTYKSIFLRIEANLTPDAAGRRGLLEEADALRNKAVEIRRGQPYVPQPGEPPPPPPPVAPAPARQGAQTSPTPRFMPPPPPPMLVTGSDGSSSVVVPSPAAPMVAPMPPAFQRAVEALQPLRVGGDVKSPVKTRDVKPSYPAEARAAGVQGVIVVEMLVNPAGEVVDARVLRSIPLLDDAALDAVRQWRFMPTLLNGEPHSVLLTVTVSFRLP